MFEVVLLLSILAALFGAGLYLLRSFGAPTARERGIEIEDAVRRARGGADDIAITVTQGWCVFIRDSQGRGLETWIDDRPYQTPHELAARALAELGLPAVRAPPAPTEGWASEAAEGASRPRASGRSS